MDAAARDRMHRRVGVSGVKLCILSRYDRKGASSRLRVMQYRAHLEAAGFSVDVIPLFSDGYLDKLYGGGSTLPDVLRAYGRRLSDLKRLMERPQPDIIWVQKEALPWVPWRLEGRLLPHGPSLVTDYDDAVFHRYDAHRLSAVRWALGSKIDQVMAHSDLVTAGNPYLADRARQAGAPRVEIIPTVVDCSQYGTADPVAGDPVIGWIGTPGTWKECVSPVLPLLADILQDTGARLRAVGAGAAAAGHEGIDVLDWSEDQEVALIQGMSIGIMPLPDTPWTQGKCGYKLIQYMACGLPVVASPVGVNREIVDHGVNGFLANTDEAWRVALDKLVSDPELRIRMGQAGRKKVLDRYSLQVQGPRVAWMFKTLTEERAMRDVSTQLRLATVSPGVPAGSMGRRMP